MHIKLRNRQIFFVYMYNARKNYYHLYYYYLQNYQLVALFREHSKVGEKCVQKLLAFLFFFKKKGKKQKEK